MIHYDRVERTIFGAEATIHTDVRVDEELGRFRNWAASIRVIGAYNPDALGWADFRTNSTGSAANFLLALGRLIINKEWDITRFLGQDQPFFRILNRKDTFRILTGAVLDSFFRVIALFPAQEPSDIINIRIPESLPGNA